MNGIRKLPFTLSQSKGLIRGSLIRFLIPWGRRFEAGLFLLVSPCPAQMKRRLPAAVSSFKAISEPFPQPAADGTALPAQWRIFGRRDLSSGVLPPHPNFIPHCD